MAISRKLKAYLAKSKAKFKTLKHHVAYTAQEIAAASHVPGRQVLKSVIIKLDKEFIMAVLPAIHLVDFAAIKKTAGSKKAKLASEDEIAKIFPDYEVGAMPPFGNLYNVSVIFDKALKESEAQDVVFNAGSHVDLVKMKYKDLEKLIKPKVAVIGKEVD